MTNGNTYMNEYDHALSLLVSWPIYSLRVLHGDRIRYLSAVVDKAHNAGMDSNNIVSLLFLINSQITKLSFNEELIDQIIDTVQICYTSKEASK
ncbi:hypothetical protein ESZ50_09000 [Weissella muntiaci]|uniref:Uncharacterized protein n=1 Tax=Weissella muntiaci TaxID=2508881 RepID=A0A6C2C331_9LACO|nr:hypothetical protein [Weissella muntiaci]TYC48371.1 hypothetical protein ESZ50_09000 [Weissella muntiaci]